MKIERNLYLVMPVDQGDGSTVYVHSAPISKEVFESFYMVLGQAFTEIHKRGLGVISGPRLAAFILRDVARAAGTEAEVDKGLFSEMRRLTHVLALRPKGWETIPYDEAVKTGILDEDDVSEVENALVFFTCGWRIHKKSERETVMSGALRLWGGSMSSSNCTAYAASLPTSTETESSGEKPKAASSLPS